MNSDFEKFTQAVQSRSNPAAPDLSPMAYQRVCVLGGGVEGRVLAALALAENLEVVLFSAYGAELDRLRQDGSVTLRGEGPVGTFPVDQSAGPSIVTTAQLDHAVSEADVIFLTGPVHKQKTYAMVLADHLVDGQVLVVAPARTFAALEVSWLLKTGGCKSRVSIVELSQLPYWIHAEHKHWHLSAVASIDGAGFPDGRMDRVNGLSPIFGPLQAKNSTINSAFNDASGVIEAVAIMFGGSLIAEPNQTLPIGAIPLEERKTFHSLIDGVQSQNLIKAALDERRQVAKRYGVRDLPDDETWVSVQSGRPAGRGARPIPSLSEARTMLRCAVSGSLVPLQSAARHMKLTTPITDSLIHLAGASLSFDLTAGGRRMDTMGLGQWADADPGEIRKRVAAVSRGRSDG